MLKETLLIFLISINYKTLADLDSDVKLIKCLGKRFLL